MQDWWSDDKQVESTVSIEEFDRFLKDLFSQREKLDQIKDNLKSEQETLTKMEAKTLTYLKLLGRENYKSPLGSVGVMKRLSVTLPKTPEEKQAFFEYLKSKNLFDNMISVNSQTLNSWYKQEYEVAAEEKRLSDFKIPGIKEPTVFETIRVTKGR